MLDVQHIDGTSAGAIAISKHDRNFVYTVGKEVSVKGFCEDRRKECAAGIHFFVTRQEAVDY